MKPSGRELSVSEITYTLEGLSHTSTKVIDEEKTSALRARSAENELENDEKRARGEGQS